MSAAPHALDHVSLHQDRDLCSKVMGELWEFEPLRTSKSLVLVTAEEGGRVTLDGNVRSDMMKAMAGRLARRVSGVTSVDNRLVADTEIEAAIAGELGRGDVALFTDGLDLESRLGTVYVGGRVVTADRARAESTLDSVLALIADLPGVHDVIRRTEVVEGTEPAAGPDSAVVASGALGDQEMQERLRVWRERAASVKQ